MASGAILVAWTFGAAWALGSGAAMVLLGLSLLRLRPRRASTMLFAGFCLAWGAQILVANVARGLHPSPYDEVLILLGAALLPPAYLFLGRFVTGFPFPADRRVAGGLVGLLALLAAGTAAAAILSPGLLLEGVERFPTFFAPRYGPAFLYLVTVPFFATFDFAALWLLHVLRGAKGASRQQVRFMLAGVLLFVSYINVAGFLPLVMAPAGEAVLLGLFGAGTLLVAVVAAQLAAQRPPEGPDPLLLACVLVPAAAAAAEAGLAVAGVSGIVQTLGLWRLLGIGLVAYAIARFQVFDIEVRLKHSFAQAAPYGAAGLAAAAALTAFETAGLGVAMGVMVATGAAAGLVTLWRKEAAARMLFPAETSNPQYLYHRRIEVYRAALERLLAEKTPDPADEQILGKLRRSLGITNREHQLLEYMVRERLAAGAAAPRPSAKAEVGALLAERFRILRVLGEGAYGRAYLAQDERLEREVVVKAVHAAAGAEDAKLLAREARIAGALRHPNVLAIYDVVEAPSDAFIVMEYADGGSLDQVLSRKGRLPLEEAVGVVDQLLSGLAAAHAAGIVHRDIKPSNLLLSKDGVVKLADFGVARRPGKDATFLASAPVGTLAYMSPEQVDMRAVDARSDLYAVGVMFYELLTGRFYLKMGGKDQFEVCELIRHASPLLPLEDQPAWVNEVLAGALAKDPAQRFRSAEAMRDALLQQAVPQAVMTNRA